MERRQAPPQQSKAEAGKGSGHCPQSGSQHGYMEMPGPSPWGTRRLGHGEASAGWQFLSPPESRFSRVLGLSWSG